MAGILGSVYSFLGRELASMSWQIGVTKLTSHECQLTFVTLNVAKQAVKLGT